MERQYEREWPSPLECSGAGPERRLIVARDRSLRGRRSRLRTQGRYSHTSRGARRGGVHPGGLCHLRKPTRSQSDYEGSSWVPSSGGLPWGASRSSWHVDAPHAHARVEEVHRPQILQFSSPASSRDRALCPTWCVGFLGPASSVFATRLHLAAAQGGLRHSGSACRLHGY